MAVRFFGQYLLESRAISSEQLLQGITYQEKHNRKFGDTAISLGLLDEEKLAQALALQKSEDLKVGEAAVRLGYLTPPQVEQVLLAQRNSHVFIGEALVVTGALSRSELEKSLTAFRTEQEAFRVTTSVPKLLDPTGIATPAVDLTLKFLLRMVELQARIGECRAGTLPATARPSYTARVSFSGTHEGELVLRCDPDLGARIATKIAGERISPADEPGVIDGMRELVNVVAGSLAAALARQGLSLEVGAPRNGPLPAPGPEDNVLSCQLASPEGGLDFAVVTRPGKREA